MPKQAIVCISTLAKLAIIDRAKRTKLTEEESQAIGDLADVPECSDDAFLKIGGAPARSRRSKDKAKRESSEYNLFMGKCMKEGNIKSFAEAGPRMKQCALEWRKKKAEK